ncbi:MAG: EamA family transporter [Anaerolineae bacterium]|nr:EamA family transporter [Anaerolineae bacterium]
MSDPSSQSSPSAVSTWSRLKVSLIPPWLLVVIAIVSVQVGAGMAKSLFPVAQPTGVVLLRTAIAAVMFWLVWRPKLAGHSRRSWLLVTCYGVNLAAMMLSFYLAIDLIPLGVSVAIAFAGPLTVAVIGSRRPLDFVWVVVAAVGILLLSPFTNEALDPIGVGLAVFSAIMWGTYVYLSRIVGKTFRGSDGLTISMTIAAIVSIPTGLGGAVSTLIRPDLLLLTLAVAFFSSAVPFALEFAAAQRLKPRVFSMLLSLEPVIATIVGALFLAQNLKVQEIIGVALVTIAAAASSSHTQEQ